MFLHHPPREIEPKSESLAKWFCCEEGFKYTVREIRCDFMSVVFDFYKNGLSLQFS